MSKLEQAIAGMAELTNAIREKKQAGQNPAELQWSEVEKQFQAQIDAKVAAEVQAKLDTAPQRRVAGGDIVHSGNSAALSKNRYGTFLKSFDQGQAHRDGPQNFRPVDLWLAQKMMEGQVKNWHPLMGDQRPVLPSNDLIEAVKALTSTGSGTGDELVPTNMAAQLWDDFFLMSKIVGTLINIPMTSNPFDVPLGLGDVVWYKGTENTAVTASDPATAKVTFTATELVTEQNWSYTLDEDAVVAMAPAIRARLAISGGEIMDDFALNADSTNAGTGNINLDDADPADTKYYLSDGQDGIRHQWLVDNTAQTFNAGGDALIDSDVVSALALMGKYAIDPNRLVMAMDSQTYLKGFLGLDGVLTLDKFGPSAVLLTGQLAAYRGIPIVVSASHRLAEADGKLSTTGSNNTLGSVSIYNRTMWGVGFLRNLLIEVDRNIQKRQFLMVTSLREAVGTHGVRSTNTHTSGIRNILV